MTGRPDRPRRLVPLALAGLLLFAVGCTEAISGTPSAGPSTRNVADEIGDTPASDLRSGFNASEQDVNEYWDSERIRNARPEAPSEGEGDAPSRDPLENSYILDPSTGPVAEVAPDANGSVDTGDEWSRAGLSAQTVGRLYLSKNGEPLVCSAAIVNSDSGSLVATAAHCVWDYAGADEWASNVLFVPGDSGGDAPHGRWAAERMYAPTEFIESAGVNEDGGVVGDGWAYDFAFLRMRPLDGQQIQAALGAQGIAFGEPAEGLLVIGYPTAPPFDGTTMRYCASPSWVEGAFGTYSIPCSMTPGCSGGPWFTRFDPQTGTGYLVATTSTVGSNVSGSQFNEVAESLYRQANGG